MTFSLAQNGRESNAKIEKCWEFRSEQASIGFLASDSEQIYLRAGDGRLIALSAQGVQQWSNDIGGEIVSNLAISSDSLFVVSAPRSTTGENNNTKIEVISRRSGLTLKTAPLPEGERFFLVEDSGAIVAVGSAGSIDAFDVKLDRLWNFNVTGQLDLEPVVHDGGLTIAANGRSLLQISIKSGETLSRIAGDSDLSAIARDDQGTIFLGDKKGRLYRLKPADGREQWAFKSGGQIQAIIFNGSKIIASSVDNFIYAISADRGSVVWKARLPGRSVGPINLIKDTLLVSVIGQGEIFAIDGTSGRITDRIKVGPENSLNAMVMAYRDDMFVIGLGNSATAYSFSGCAK